MANLQRMLGLMLASRMGGRGRTGGALGTAAMLGGLGGGGLGRKAGLAALGYLAYRAFNNNQTQPQGAADPAARATSGSGGGLGGGLGGLVDSLSGRGASAGGGGQSIGERIGAVFNPQSRESAPEIPEGAQVGDNKALLLIRAMIAAANSDGSISAEERGRVISSLEQAGGDAEDRRVIEAELRNPRPLDALLREVEGPEAAQQFYLASRAAIDGGSTAQKSYLAYLRDRLGLSDEDVAEVDRMAS